MGERISLAEQLPTVLQLYLNDTRYQLKAIEHILTAQSDMGRIILMAQSIRASSAHMGMHSMVDAANALGAAAHDHVNGEAQQEMICILAQIKSIFAEAEQALAAQAEPAV